MPRGDIADPLNDGLDAVLGDLATALYLEDAQVGSEALRAGLGDGLEHFVVDDGVLEVDEGDFGDLVVPRDSLVALLGLERRDGLPPLEVGFADLADGLDARVGELVAVGEVECLQVLEVVGGGQCDQELVVDEVLQLE